MNASDHRDHRESLSALFDGELHGDASRFAHKQLAHDVQCRRAFGNWQLVGDVLRGRATAAAPEDFADRVQRALAHEAAAAAAMPAEGRKASRRGWVGGAALAASVAVAAWFVASPFDEAPAVMPAATSIAAMNQPAAVPVPATTLTLPPPVVAAQSAARDDARPPRTQVRRMADRGARQVATARGEAVPVPAMASAAPAVNGAIAATALADPFRLPSRPAAKPWPRAVLPNDRSAGTLTTGYGGPGQQGGAFPDESPTFYPFEPRLAIDTGTAASPSPPWP